MTLDGAFDIAGLSLQVFLIDLLLGGDNALVIGLVCRSLPPRQMRRAMIFGTAAAIVLRIYLTTIVSWLLAIPFLKLLGGVALLLIAIKLLVEEDSERQVPGGAAPEGEQELWVAIVLIVIADLVMSLDNVIGLAAAARGSMLVLAGGLLFSLPLLIYGSLFVAALLKRYPLLITAGSALLGWLGGDIAMADPILAGWVTSQAPALGVAVPFLAAIFVVMESRIVRADRAALAPVGGTSPGEDMIPALARLAGRRFSRSKSRPAEAGYVPPSREAALEAGTLILLADDNPVDQSDLCHALERLGYAVETARNGQEALEKIGKSRYGLLLTDHEMPVKSGLVLAAELRAGESQAGGHLPIIGLLGYLSTDVLKRKCLEAGMDDCLTKGSPDEAVEAMVRAWLPAAEAMRGRRAPVEEG